MSRGGDFNFDAYLSLASSNVTAEPITISCWFFSNADSDTNSTMVHVGSSSGDRGATLRFRMGSSNRNPQIYNSGSGGSGTANAGDDNGDSTWNHAAAVCSSTSSRFAYINGSASSEGTDDVTGQGTYDQITIGERYSLGKEFPGYLADVAIWDVALTQAEITELSLGISPFLIRPGSLVHYFPLIRGLEDLVGGTSLTEVGTVSVQEHFRINELKRKQSFLGAVASAFTKDLAGSLSLSGSLSAVGNFVKSLAGTLGFSGDLTTALLEYVAPTGSSSTKRLRIRRKK